jgi:hypothetical protein
VLGRTPLAGRQQMHLVRFGGKLVLVVVSPDGVSAVSEITESVEVDRLAGYCQQTTRFSATTAFRGILDRLDERNLREVDERPARFDRGSAPLASRKNSAAGNDYA